MDERVLARRLPAGAWILVLIVVSTSGCAGLASGENEGGRGAASPAASTSPTPQQAAALDLWEGFGAVPGHEIGRYDSLRAMADGAHAVVGAVVTAVDGDHITGPPEGLLRAVRVTLQVTEVLKGEFGVGDAIPVIVGLAELDVNVEEEYAELVGDEGIFFIVPVGAPRPEFGIEGRPPDKRSGDWGLVTSQGVVIDDRGTGVFATDIVDRFYPKKRFPEVFREQLAYRHINGRDLEGMPFAEIRTRIQEAVDEES